MEFFRFSKEFIFFVDYDLKKSVWVESVIDSNKEELVVELTDPTSLYELSRAIMVCMVSEDYEYESVFCGRVIKIFKDDDKQFCVAFQASAAEVDELADSVCFDVDLQVLDKERVLRLFDFFTKASQLALSKRVDGVLSDLSEKKEEAVDK